MIEAARAFYESEDFSRANLALSQVRASELPSSRRQDYAELIVLLALESGDEETIAIWLEETNFEAGQGAEVRARLCVLGEHFACAAEETMRAALWHEAPESLNEQIWEYLVRAGRKGQASTAMAANRTSQGWWSLLDLVSSPDPVASHQDRYRLWQRKFPNHPATRNLPKGLRYLVEPWSQPDRIAIMLPLSGPLAAAGQAVRDGIMAAHLDNASQEKARLFFYDSASADVASLYEKAIVAGAGLIIGPLIQSNVSALATVVTDVPVIALNRSDTIPASPHFLQLSLAIEDEAATITSRLLEDGHERILAVVADGKQWAARAEGVLSQTPFPMTKIARVTDATQMTRAIGDAMLVTASQQRHRRIQDVIGELVEFSPRGRRDLDAVVAFIDEVQARALAPALRYHFADELPVYTGSQAIRGNNQIGALQGFYITEIPMLLYPTGIGVGLSEAFDLGAGSTGALFALGADAYLVADRHQIMAGAGTGAVGQTGVLYLNERGQVERRQPWGRVIQGRLVAQPTK